jgi:hypothetical protein
MQENSNVKRLAKLGHIFGITGKPLNEQGLMEVILLFLDLRCRKY